MFKKILAYALTVCLLISATVVPAYAVDETVTGAPVIYYTDGYTPGMYADVDRSVSLLASTRASYGSYSSFGYVPTGFDDPSSGGVRQWTFADYPPIVTDGVSSVSATSTIPATYFLSGSMLTVTIPSTQDAYFDFQSSNILFDQSSPSADTFYLNGTLTFKLSNLWSFVSSSSDYDDVSYYRASDPLAVQLLINGKPYGDIVDVTSYTSLFRGPNNGTPANASVTFDDLKVYYQGDTPELIGFRVYTGSAYGQSSHTYGDYQTLTLQNLISFQWSEQPDITFVDESTGSDYTGDLNGINTLLSSVKDVLSNIYSSLRVTGGWYILSSDGSVKLQSSDPLGLAQIVRHGFMGLSQNLFDLLRVSSEWVILNYDGSLTTLTSSQSLAHLVRVGFMGLRSLAVNSSGVSYLSYLPSLKSSFDSFASEWRVSSGTQFLNSNGQVVTSDASMLFSGVVRRGLLGLASVSRDAQSYVADTVFPWRSFNMQTHQLNASTNITGQNNLFLTAFQSMEDKLGRLAYVFGSDEDLALKDSADPGTDAFRENFGGGASLSDIKDASELTTSIPQIMDTGFDFGDALEEIGSNDDFLAWFSSETWAALDSTGAAVAADPDYLSDYYDNLRKVEEKRHWGD